uniref:Uncharacterized protein n=1 Tax=Acrobeloides nanus TaxID=290746 RepID=A0A914DLR1_9BILA
MCREHPNYRAQDRIDSSNEGLTRAERTLPAFLKIKESSIANA